MQTPKLNTFTVSHNAANYRLFLSALLHLAYSICCVEQPDSQPNISQDRKGGWGVQLCKTKNKCFVLYDKIFKNLAKVPL